jgi:hypothetical protein
MYQIWGPPLLGMADLKNLLFLSFSINTFYTPATSLIQSRKDETLA